MTGFSRSIARLRPEYDTTTTGVPVILEIQEKNLQKMQLVPRSTATRGRRRLRRRRPSMAHAPNENKNSGVARCSSTRVCTHSCTALSNFNDWKSRARRLSDNLHTLRSYDFASPPRRRRRRPTNGARSLPGRPPGLSGTAVGSANYTLDRSCVGLLLVALLSSSRRGVVAVLV